LIQNDQALLDASLKTQWRSPDKRPQAKPYGSSNRAQTSRS
jgi:hypothetical protein